MPLSNALRTGDLRASDLSRKMGRNWTTGRAADPRRHGDDYYCLENLSDRTPRLVANVPTRCDSYSDPLGVGFGAQLEVRFITAALAHLLDHQAQLFSQYLSTCWCRDLEQVVERGDETTTDLRRGRPRETDLVESQMDVRVPVHFGNCHSQTAGVVEQSTVRQNTVGQLSQPVVQTVDALHGRGWVEKGGVRE